MKIICPVCELFLVEVSMESGLGSFFCERCAESNRQLCSLEKPCVRD